MIALQLARWAVEAGLHHRPDLGEVTLLELGRALATKRSLSEAVTTCRRISERRLCVAAMVRGKERGR